SVIVHDANGCTFTTSFQVTEPDVLSVTASGNSPLCSGSELDLSSDGSGGTPPYSYQWSGPGGFTSSDQNPVLNNVSAAASGDYTVSVTDGNSCSENFTTTISIATAPTAFAGSNTSVCSGQSSYALNTAAAGGYASISWSTNGDGTF